MILSRDAIKKELKSGRVVINPFHEDQIGPASIDLTLDDEFRVFLGNQSIRITDDADFTKVTRVVKQKSYKLKPGESILGITRETIKLPSDMCGWLQGRSRFARLGLSVHITASFIQPGIHNRQVFEITNVGPVTLELVAGERIGQLVLERVEGKASYKGKFEHQVRV